MNRARDTKLQRDVAIKILQETIALDAGRMGGIELEWYWMKNLPA